MDNTRVWQDTEHTEKIETMKMMSEVPVKSVAKPTMTIHQLLAMKEHTRALSHNLI